MSGAQPNDPRDAEIRRRAEAKSRTEHSPVFDSSDPEGIRRLVHELHVHQIELELQNEQLRATQVDLESSRARFFDLFDLAPVGYFTLGESGSIVEANFTLCALLGSTRAQLLNHSFTQLIVPEDQDAFYLSYKGVMNTGANNGFELRLRRAGGQSFWARIEASLVLDPDGTRQFRAVVSDVSERKRIERELRSAHTRLEALWGISAFEETPDRSIEDHILDAITRMTESEFSFFGFVNDEQTVMMRQAWSGAAMESCSIQERQTRFEIAKAGVWAEAVRTKAPLILNSYQVPHPAKRGLPEGHVLIRNLMAIPSVVNGTVSMVAAVANKTGDYSTDDVRQVSAYLLGIEGFYERRRAARERERIQVQGFQNQKVESLGRMAGAVAHHFNNQLQVVIGNLEMTSHEAVTPAEIAHCAKKALLAARRSAELSCQMRTYLGQTAGGQEPLNLFEVCEQALVILRAGLPKNVILETDFAVSNLAIYGNGNQVTQILTNLVTNAAEAYGNGSGTVRLAIRSVPAEEIPTHNRFPFDWQPLEPTMVCLEVADAGQGISPNDLDRIFDPFFSSKFTGRGMGLSIVLGLMRAHHGGIVVESALGRGSAFRLYFPPASSQSLQTRGKTALTPLTWKGTMLVVDDESMIREMMATMLKILGIPVLEACDGVEAVEVLRRSRSEIRGVICDLTMPRMNGWETMKALHQIEPGLPIILASGHDEAHALSATNGEKPQVFLRKPYGFDRLREAICAISPR